MSGPMPIRKYMSLAPKVIGYDQNLGQASDYMRKLHVHHLPVSKAGKLIGVISERDINLALYFRNDGLKMTVTEALTEKPYFAPSDMSVQEVAGQMVTGRFGCVLVMEHGRLVGIFTCIDALKALAESFRDDARKPA